MFEAFLSRVRGALCQRHHGGGITPSMAQTRAILSQLAVASQDSSGAIATPPTWALWPFRMARGCRRRYPDGPGYGSIPMGQVMVCRG